jgi:hypothetical protein
MSRRVFAAAGAAAALVPSLVMWGFTVDDAFIPLRYAKHLAAGLGWRFNSGGPPTDGVTPLPWVPLLALFADGELFPAKVFGVVAWTIGGAVLGARLSSVSSARFAGLALAFVAFAFPIGAWAASGMETGLATALATIAACSLDRERRAALFAGLAASLRPELTPWACALVGLSARGARAKAIAVAIAIGPFLACTIARLVFFGQPAPLAVYAKPSDLAHGATYAGAAFVVMLLPILAFAPLAIRRATPDVRAIAIGFGVHVATVIAVGGDWMPYARLLVPVVPSLALAFVATVPLAHRVSTAARAALAAGIGLLVAMRSAPAGRHVTRDRLALVEGARPVLASSKTIAALDVGWASAAAPQATIVDLAGLTDPTIAALPGGHTSKRVDTAMLVERNVDTVIIYSKVRVVEARLIESELFRERFDRIADVPVGAERYAVYRVLAP